MAQATNSPTYSDEPRKDTREDDEELYKEFTSEQDLSEEEQAKLVTKLDDMFRYAADHPSWTRGRTKMIECFKYREGEQWTAAEKAELEERHQPDTVNNQISVVVNKLVGELVKQRFRVGFRGRNDEQDKEISELLSDIFLYVRQSNDLEFEERDMADDGFTGGMGVLDVSVTFDDLAMPEIKVRHEDPLIVFPDPDSRAYDWNEDGKFVARAKWWKVEDAAEMYPQAADRLKGRIGEAGGSDGESSAQLSSVDHFKGEQYVDRENERIRLIEVQYKKQEREQVVVFGNGQSTKVKDIKEAKDAIKRAKEAGIPVRVIPRLVSTICVGVYAAGVLLEHTETDHKYFSLVPYFAYRRKTGEPYSLITLALSMQDAVNKRESKALHLLNTNQTIYEKSAIDDPQKLAEEKAKPDGNIELRDGALAQQRFMFKENVELASSQFQMHQQAIAALYQIVGLDPRNGQSTGELRSGAGLQRKYMEASKPVAILFDNIRRSRKVFARVVLDRVQKYFTPQKTFLITDDENKSKLVGISVDAMQRIKTGQFDAVVDEFEDDPTTQDEQFRIFAETLPAILQFPPIYTAMLVKMSRIRNKDEVLKVLESQQGPPPLQPKMNLQANLDALEPVERAGVWTLVGKPEIAQAIMQTQPAPVQKLKSETELAKEQMKGAAQDPQVEQMKGEVEMAKTQMDMSKAQMEMQHKEAEHQLKMQEMITKHQLEMAKLQMQASMPQKTKKEGSANA
jgi:hypothetical protein